MRLDIDLESIQEGRRLIEQAKGAQQTIYGMSQEEINNIVGRMARVAFEESSRLASLAVEETGFGKVDDKLIKNIFAAKDVYESIREKKTVGIISNDEKNKLWEIAEPVGVVAGIVPSTNPTSTVIFKALIAVKARNAIVFSPHPAAAKCTKETSDLLQRAASQAGAPDGLISCISSPTADSAKEIMQHKQTSLILATGGSDMVKAAYSSGKPAFGVGPGNVPVFIHSSANIEKAISQIIQSKTFDYGTICASEQSVVIERSIKRKVQTELVKQGAYFLDDYEKKRIENIIIKNARLNPKIVGKSPKALAEMAGIVIPDNTKVLVAEECQIGKEYPFSWEKLAPILALYTVDHTEQGFEICSQLLKFGGMGHTAGIHSESEEVVRDFSLIQPAYRIVVNSGTTFGAIGATTGTTPSLTLGCGSLGNNITSDNIGPEHLINRKRVAYGVKEMEKSKVQSVDSAGTNHQPREQVNISRDEILDIVKSVIKELKI